MNEEFHAPPLHMDGDDFCRMSAVLRHRLRNHAAGIKSAILLLQEELKDSASPSVLEYFPLIVNECHLMDEMALRMGQLLDPPENSGSERVGTLLEVLASDVHKAFPRADIALHVDPAAGEASVSGATAILTALKEIGKNAAESGGKDRRVSIRCRGEDGAVRVEVSDAGRGIPDADRRKVFLPFYTTKSKHLGIGLTIAEKMIAACGGSIRLENSTPEGGLQVRVSLPLASAGGRGPGQPAPGHRS